ncbi:MAG TPA: metal ABC transporter permease [Firmicutes bacterium]|nr:metal ABC transporter permease [Bacillota bacterium]
MIEALFQYKFLQNALYSGILIGALAPLLGTFVVVKKLSFISDTLSHVSLAGIALGLLLQSYNLISCPPIYIGTIFSILGALLLEQLRGLFEHDKEIVMPIILSLGVALSVIFISYGNGFNAEIMGYLFGSINTVSTSDVWLLLGLTVLIFSCVFYFYNLLIAIAFNPQSSKLLGISMRKYQFIFIVVLAIVISLSIKIIGTLLISALMITPVASSMRVAKSFKQTIIIAILFSELSVILGLISSYYLNLPSGATIVIFNVLILFLTSLTRLVKGGKKS